MRSVHLDARPNRARNLIYPFLAFTISCNKLHATIHYTTEFKLQILRPILNREMSVREAARFYNLPSNALVGTWLKRFEKSGIKGLIPRKPSGRPPMKPKYAKMPPPPKTEEDRLRLRILQLEAEVAYLKELRRLRLQDEAEQRKLSKG